MPSAPPRSQRTRAPRSRPTPALFQLEATLPDGSSQKPKQLTLQISFWPEHIWVAFRILAVVAAFIACSFIQGFLHRERNLVDVAGFVVAPLGCLAQFFAIGPENHVPRQHRTVGMQAYATFFALASVASTYFATPAVAEALQSCFLRFDCGLESMPHGAKAEEELVLFAPVALMNAIFGLGTGCLGLDILGPWSVLRAVHASSGLSFLLLPALLRAGTAG